MQKISLNEKELGQVFGPSEIFFSTYQFLSDLQRKTDEPCIIKIKVPELRDAIFKKARFTEGIRAFVRSAALLSHVVVVGNTMTLLWCNTNFENADKFHYTPENVSEIYDIMSAASGVRTSDKETIENMVTGKAGYVLLEKDTCYD